MSQVPPENSNSQQPDANSTQQADSSVPQNVVRGNQSRVVQGDENQGVLGDKNTVVQVRNSIQNIHITNYYYDEYIRVAAVQPVSDASSDEKLPCPYRGLYHFRPDDAEYFFGREVFIEKLFEATQTRNFIPVLGASGSGKSSVVFAGLLPRLQQQGHWKFTYFRPGSDSDPFYALAQALVPLYRSELDSTDVLTQAGKLAQSLKDGQPLNRIFTLIQRNHPNHQLLLIADQFEEIYTVCTDEVIRESFLKCLLTSIESSTNQFPYSAVLVATMRADFLGNALSYRRFADALQDADIKLPAMNREELSQVIEEPAQKSKVMFEVRLVERILNDVEDEPGNLPLLEFALTSLWYERQGNQLTHCAYEAIGEVKGALAKYADEKYDKLLNFAEPEELRRIFIQLVRPGEGTEDTRRLATKAELGEDSWSLVKQLADARLVVTSRNATNEETVEVVHEALIQNWTQLQEWIEKDRNFRIWQERLRTAIDQWKEAKKYEGYLLQAAPLAVAENWLQERPDEVSLKEQEFIKKSLERRDREQSDQKRLINILSGVSIGLIVVVLVVAWQWSNSDKQQQIANSEKSALSALRQFESEGQEIEALLSAIQAGQKLKRLVGDSPVLQDYPTKKPIFVLQNILNKIREKTKIPQEGRAEIAIFSPNKDNKLVVASVNKVKVWDWLSGKELTNSSDYHKETVNSISFSPDGKFVVTASDDNVYVWNWSSWLQGRKEPDGAFALDRGSFKDAIFSPNGKFIIAASGDSVYVWNWLSDTQPAKYQLNKNKAINSINFSSDGKYIVAASGDNVYVWNWLSGKNWLADKPKIKLQHETDAKFKGSVNVNGASFSPDGKLIFTAVNDGTIHIWSLDGKRLEKLQVHQYSVNSIGFNKVGNQLITASFDGTALIWDWDSATLPMKLKHTIKHQGGINSTSFSPDGTQVVTASDDKTVRVWNLRENLPVWQISKPLEHSEQVNSASFSPDGTQVVTASDDETSKVWDWKSNKFIDIKHKDGVSSASFSPNGQKIVTASHNKSVRVWNYLGKENKVSFFKELKEHNGDVKSASFDPGSKTIITTSADDTVLTWNFENGNKKKVLTEQKFVNSANVSPRGNDIIVVASEYIARLWNLREPQKLIIEFQGHTSFVNSVSFNQDGTRIVTASADNTARIWDVQTGEQLKELRGHTSFVNSASFSQDDTRIVTASADNTARIWDVQTGEQLAELQGHQKEVDSASFHPKDNNTIVTASADKTVRVWKVEEDLEKIIKQGCTWLGNYFKVTPKKKPEECRKYFESES